MIKKVNLKSELLKYIVVLMSGTFLAQVLTYIFAPIISRLYTPEDFGDLAIFMRLVSVGAAIATLRYEPSLPIVKGDAQSFRLYRFALRSTIIVTIVSLIVIIVPAALSKDVNEALYYVLLPVALLFMAIYNIGTNWAIRHKMFRVISYTKVANNLSAGLLKIGLGWLKMGYIGLVIGTVAGLGLSTIWFVRDFFTAKKKYRIKSKSPGNYILAKEHKDYPLINLPHAAMDLGRDLLIAVLILELFSKADLGLYDYSYKMLRFPLVLAGMAIGQVFLQRCAEKVNNNEDIVPMITKAVKSLMVLSIIPFATVFFFGEEIFAFVFGEEWRGAGRFSEIMAPWFLVNFIASPISTLPLILNKQRVFFKLGMIGTTLMIGTMSIPPLVYNASVETTLWIVSCTQAGYLVFVIFKKFEFARKHNVG